MLTIWPSGTVLIWTQNMCPPLCKLLITVLFLCYTELSMAEINDENNKTQNDFIAVQRQ